MRQNPKPQEIYKHFKGNVYQVITLARNSDTGEKMVVYQQLYAPYEIYVRPLERFMREIDTKKYPDEKQVYRFERIDVRGEADVWESKETSADTINRLLGREKKEEPVKASAPGAEGEAGGYELDAGLVEFLDADSYEKKLQILSTLHPRITDAMIDTMAVSLDTEVKEGDIEARYAEIKSCLIMLERFECNRLR